ncbi:MAG: ATP-binding cassette domain-containing protein [Chthoniobacteraceae bacterium]
MIRGAILPPVRLVRRFFSRGWRRLTGKPRPVEEQSLFPLVIQVLAGFSKTAGEVVEEEVDTVLGLLRHGFPGGVYEDMRRQFREALGQQQDLNSMADRLSRMLSAEQKVVLGVQLYDIIARSEKRDEQMPAFYGFMDRLGMAAQAIEIVHQLQAGEKADASVTQTGELPLEVLTFGRDAQADVWLKSLRPGERLIAFRYHALTLLKNAGPRPVYMRGRPLAPGAFSRIYSGQRVILDEQVLTYEDIISFFNAKKGVFLTHVYLEINDNDEVELSRVRTRNSVLEVRFGLKVQVRALADVDALLNGVSLRAGTMLNATQEDRIIFHNSAELTLADLRRRARALGVRFHLKSYKSTYAVSNNPSRLEVDDILLSPGTSGEVLLKVHCDYDNKVGKLDVIAADRPVAVGERIVPVGGTCDLKDGDFIRIDAGQGLRCDFAERIIEEERNIISSLELRDVTCHFGGHVTALDGINFTFNRGDVVCVMGGSGSGKSTLLRAIAGRLPPSRGQILLNGQDLYGNLDEFKRFIAYIPQDDAFDDHLTVEENLNYATALRSPHLSTSDRARRIGSRLVELGLSERRDVIVGSPEKKTLSGGERKRLNIGLDMISPADIFLFDEPTSGLSSKDSEHVIDIIRGLSHNKIVLVVIHQPSARLFHLFNKAVLLDRGGKLVFSGSPDEMMDYFADAAIEENVTAARGAKAEGGSPEFCFDILETPLHDLSGDLILEEGSNGQLIPARRFSSDFWRDRYETYRLTQEMKQVSLKRQAPGPAPALPAAPEIRRQPAPRKLRWREEWLHFHVLLRRAFLSKLRNVASLLVTLLAPPLLAFVVAWALYFTEESDRPYIFASAFHIPTYIFISLLVALFLALMNSVEDIIRDRNILQRERNLDVRVGYYVAAKFLTLCVFSAIQCALFVVLGNAILEIRGMFWIYFTWTFLTAISGISLGLLVSALVPNSKTGATLVPLILIPQLIFGGALIKYEEMNRDPDMLYVFQRWFAAKKQPTDMEGDKKLRVPAISRFVATHYSYEAMVVAQAKLNPLAIRQQRLQRQIEELAARPTPEQKETMLAAAEAALRAQAMKNPRDRDGLEPLEKQVARIKALAPRTEDDDERLDDLKDTLAQLSGLEAGTAREIDKRLRKVDQIIAGRIPTKADFRTTVYGVTAAQLYTNQKITDMVDKAETEQDDYRRNYRINVFFSPKKYHFSLGTAKGGIATSVYIRNGALLLASSLALLVILWWVLRRQLRRTGV